jgi:hypothetical protein
MDASFFLFELQAALNHTLCMSALLLNAARSPPPLAMQTALRNMSDGGSGGKVVVLAVAVLLQRRESCEQMHAFNSRGYVKSQQQDQYPVPSWPSALFSPSPLW